MIFEIAIIFALIILNGVFSMSEIAMVSSRKSKLALQAAEGNKKAKAALDLANSPDKFLSTVQVGITLIGILTGLYGGATISGRLAEYLRDANIFYEQSELVSVVFVVVIITFLSLVLGELLPKRIGLSNPERIASTVAYPMSLLSKIGAPAVWILSTSTNMLAKIFNIKSRKENFISEEEIRSMMGDASEAGELEKQEREIVERVFFLGDANVGSLMTPKVEVLAININDDSEKNRQLIADSLHTNFIVYEENFDNVLGVLNLKKLFPFIFKSGQLPLRDMITPALFVPEKTSAYKLLENMKNSQTNFVIAVNEYGAVSGVITTSDLFKALVGNLYTEDKSPEIVKREDGSYLVDGLISLDEFYRYFGITDTEEINNQGFFSLGGLILFIAKKIPSSSQIFTWRNWNFEIIDMDGARVDKVLIKKSDTVEKQL